MNVSSKGLRAGQARFVLGGIGLSTFWRYASRADFPKARKLSPRCTIWIESELVEWRDRHICGGAKK